MTPFNSRALLAAMESSRRQTHHHLDLVHRRIAGRAERLTVTRKAKSRSHRRGRSNWTPSDEELFREHLDRLTFERRGEIEALSRKLARQDQALAVIREKLGETVGGGGVTERANTRPANGVIPARVGLAAGIASSPELRSSV